MKNREIYLIPKSTATLTQSGLLAMLQHQRQKGSEFGPALLLDARLMAPQLVDGGDVGLVRSKISDAFQNVRALLERVVIKKNRAFQFLGTFNAADHQLPLIVRFVSNLAQRPWNLSLQNSLHNSAI